jgi:hypothetical protein
VPIFQYQNYQSPYANTIAQLIAHQSDPQAQAAQTIAAANARAGEIGANAWGGAVQNIAGAGASLAQTVERAREQAPIIATRELQLKNLQDAERGKAALATVLQGNTLQPNEEGPRLPTFLTADHHYDIPAVSDWLNSRGLGDQTPDLVAGLQKQNEQLDQSRAAQLAAANESTKYMAGAAQNARTLIKMGMPPDQAITVSSRQGVNAQQFTPQQVADVQAQVAAAGSPEAQLAILQNLVKAGDQLAPKVKLGEGEQLLGGVSGDVLATGQAKPPTQWSLAADAGTLGTPNQTPTAQQSMAALKAGRTPVTRPDNLQGLDAYARSLNLPGVTKAEDLTDAQREAYNARKMGQEVGKQVNINQQTRTFDVAHPLPLASIRLDTAVQDRLANQPAWWTDPARPVGTDQDRVDPTLGLSPAGLYQATNTYLMTGKFPPVGRGSGVQVQAQRDAILNKVGAMAREAGLDQSTLSALYQKNKDSLGGLIKTSDSVASFIGQADKNSDELLAPVLAKIPDLGSPYLNKPLRALTRDGLGDADLSQFQTALRSVQNEYARIITQPNLSGILTDTAREEAKQLINPDATVPQILASIRTLKAEGGNRLRSLTDQMNIVQQRMQLPGTGTLPPVRPPATPPPGTTGQPVEGTQGTIKGVPAIWHTNGPQGAGWYAR